MNLSFHKKLQQFLTIVAKDTNNKNLRKPLDGQRLCASLTGLTASTYLRKERINLP